MDRKIKILFIHHAAGWGGAPISMIELIKSLDKNKFQVQVLLLKNSIVAEKLFENGIDFYLPTTFFYRKVYQYFCHLETSFLKWYHIFRFFKKSILWLLSRYFYAKKELRKFDYDIVHLNSSVLTDWLAPAAKNGKVIIHVRETFKKGKFDFLYYFFRHQINKYANKIIAISYDNAKRINIPEKTIVVYNFAKTPEQKPSENSYFSKKFLYLGGSAEIKGFYTLVSALDYLDEDIKILFAGNYVLHYSKNKLKIFLKKILGIDQQKKLALQKIKSHKNAIEIGLTYNINFYLQECCCLISPFTVPHFSRPVIEAFLHKKPVIVSDVEGMDEIVTHNENGIIFKTDDAKSLANAINFIARNPIKAKQMGEKGFEIATLKFTDTNVNKISLIYEELLKIN